MSSWRCSPSPPRLLAQEEQGARTDTAAAVGRALQVPELRAVTAPHAAAHLSARPSRGRCGRGRRTTRRAGPPGRRPHRTKRPEGRPVCGRAACSRGGPPRWSARWADARDGRRRVPATVSLPETAGLLSDLGSGEGPRWRERPTVLWYLDFRPAGARGRSGGEVETSCSSTTRRRPVADCRAVGCSSCPCSVRALHRGRRRRRVRWWVPLLAVAGDSVVAREARRPPSPSPHHPHATASGRPRPQHQPK
jgi:hypothetical protein